MSDLLHPTAEKMRNAVEHLRDVFARLNIGRASTALVEDIVIDVYGSMSPLKGIGNVGTPDASTIVISPWDRTNIPAIEKALLAANLGLTPQNDGVVVRLNIPKPTEEKRKELAKVVREEAERARIAVRAARQDLHTSMKEGMKDGSVTEDDQHSVDKKLQDLTDKTNAEIEELTAKKEHDLLSI